jgi:hypothetical protein
MQIKRPELGEVNIFEGVHCYKFIHYINEMNEYCTFLENSVKEKDLKIDKLVLEIMKLEDEFGCI